MITKMLFSIAFSILFFHSFSQDIDLSKGWKMKIGDNPEFANPGIEDESWQDIIVGWEWEPQHHPNYNGVAWYRKKVMIPSSLKKDNLLRQAVKISLGKIDDNDITYLNGKVIGQTFGYTETREYLVPFSQIQWDQENIIAVKVEDRGGEGGMYKGPYAISGSTKLSSILSLSSKETAVALSSTGETKVSKMVLLKALPLIEKVQGRLTVKIKNAAINNTVFQKSQIITAGNKGMSSFSYSFTITQPGTYTASYIFMEQTTGDSILYQPSFLAYKKGKHYNEQSIVPVVPNKVTGKVLSFPLEKIHVKGYTGERLDINLSKRILQIDEAGILEGFINRPGKQEWVGEYPGKYLHAASRIWRYSGNQSLKTQMDRIADILISSQKEDGYLGTYLPIEYWTSWDVWAHKYDILGLLSYYSVTGYKPALETCKKIGDLLCKTFGANKGQLNIVATGYHSGMASASVLEPMTELYRFTNEARYLDFCKYIIQSYQSEKGPKIISTLNSIGKVDKTANGKAYEMMSNFTGIVKLYQLSGDTMLLKAVQTAWNDISRNKLYITGTASHHEFFSTDFDLPATDDDHMGEGCVTTTWMQFNQAMYFLKGDAQYIDEIEKSMYNHLFAGENPQTGCVSYYTALQGNKPFRCNIDGHCCLSSIPRGFALVPEIVYTKDATNGLHINIFSEGTVNAKIKTNDGRETGIALTIHSKFPEQGSAQINMETDGKADFKLVLRIPIWCRNFKAVVEGKTYTGQPGKYLTLEKKWNPHSTIDISFDLNIQQLDGGKNYPGFAAIQIGPQILAIDQTLNPDIKDPGKLNMTSASIVPLSRSLLPAGWFGSQLYELTMFAEGKPVAVKLVPFSEAGQMGGNVSVWIKRN